MKRGILLIGLLVLLASVASKAQQGPRLQWDQSAASIAEANAYQYELWINGTGQLPLRTATCIGTAPKLVCTDNAILPGQPEGTRNLQLLAIGPQGIKSLLSSNFPVTYPSAPSNLRFSN